jgi:hypothetical protein
LQIDYVLYCCLQGLLGKRFSTRWGAQYPA